MNKTKTLITIDTEVGEIAKLADEGFDKFIMGKIGNEYFGVPKIVEILESYDYVGEFFIDVYERTLFGEVRFKELSEYLHSRGHGIQLHTHPSYTFDKNRINMYEYSLREQIEIISQGKDAIKKWIGEYPIAHRAGNYGANNDTLLALAKNEIFIDSSFYYHHKNCKINVPTVNDPIFSNGVWEVPITVFKNPLKLLTIPIFFIKHWLKLDVNSLTYRDMKNAINHLSEQCRYIVLFLHSSSFILRNKSGLSIKKIDHSALTTFKKILGFIQENNDRFEVTDMATCYNEVRR